MTTFAVERSLGRISTTDLTGAQTAAIREAKASTARGAPVSYKRTVFQPETGKCTCLFEADRKSDVEAVNRAAGIPFDRISEAMDIPNPETA